MRKSIKIGDRFFCENNGTYLTVDGADRSSDILHCIVEEINEVGDLVVVDTGLYTSGELRSARWKEVIV